MSGGEFGKCGQTILPSSYLDHQQEKFMKENAKKAFKSFKPGDPRAFVFQQNNPKQHYRKKLGVRGECAAWLRYESYKTAQNWDEFLSLGGTPRDFRNDNDHNYIRMCESRELVKNSNTMAHPRPRGRPRLTQEEKDTRSAAKSLLKLQKGPKAMAPRSEVAPWHERVALAWLGFD